MNTRPALLQFLLLAGLFACLAPQQASAADPTTRFAARLVWGTDGGKPADGEMKPVAPDVEKRLRRVFKWKNYYEIDRKSFTADGTQPTQVKMSKDCRLEVAKLAAADEFEIQLFGKGKLVVKKRQRILPGESVVLGGDDKNDD